MSVDKFKFVSPGIFVDEIDNSQPNKVAKRLGPLVIGRTRKGPGMRPVKVGSYAEFVEIFGDPVAGGETGDLWRKGDVGAPMYAAYAAQAWLKNNSPLTVVRLLGEDHSQAADAGVAGWQTTNIPNTAAASSGGAYGVFIANSGSSGPERSGSLAAVFYLDQGSMYLSGNLAGADGLNNTTGSQVLVEAVANGEFRAVIKASDGSTTVKEATFNFDRNSDKFIRKVFNTDPTKVNGDITPTANVLNYWLGETFEDTITRDITGSATTDQVAVLLALKLNGSTNGFHTRRYGATASQTGWIISQDTRGSGSFSDYTPESETKLFKFIALDSGTWTHNNIKISIANVKPSSVPAVNPWGTFDVIIRRIQDSDRKIKALEVFTGCTLNPSSPNYVAARIGDEYVDWDETYRRHRSYGTYPNRSKYARIEMALGNISEEMLPFGFHGPIRFNSFTFASGSDIAGTTMVAPDEAPFREWQVQGTDRIHAHANWEHTTSLSFPALPLRAAGTDGGLSHFRQAFWGADFSRDSENGDVRFANSVSDILGRHSDLDPFSNANNRAPSFYFSLDDIVLNDETGVATYTSGSRASATSYTAVSGTLALLTASVAGINKFTMPLYGGSDGFDVTEKDPFRNTFLDDNTGERDNYGQYSIRKAIDMCADAEVVEYNVAAIPGIHRANLTDHLMDVCADRGDALALIDIENDYTPAHEVDTAPTRGDVDSATLSMRLRNIDNSYAAAYYPWVQINDRANSRLVWVPPSVVMMGVLASSERKKELWFAPAGFTRGGLSNGAAGLPVTNVRQHLTSRERDLLYDNRINPIASFPNEGIVVFGQKTLKAEASALTRVNVRRLMIYLKKEVSRIAATTLFEPNIKRTWNAFSGRVERLLDSVRSRFGIEQYRLILDESTTTADLIDRNIMYAKIFIKPTLAIEFIALDFIVTNSGAAFED